MRQTTASRQQKMLETIRKEGKIRLQELAKLYQVTTETVRQDMKSLERSGKIKKKHGWVEYETEYRELSLDAKKEENSAMKERIGRKAIEWIEDGMQIWLDPGSTVLAASKYLTLKKNLTIVTNALGILLILKDSKHKLIYIGGEYQPKGATTTGTLSAMMLSRFHFDLCLMGSDGFEKSQGATTFSLDEMLIKQIVLKNSDQALLLADQTKFEKTGSYCYAAFADFKCIITNPLTPIQRQHVQTGPKIIEV